MSYSVLYAVPESGPIEPVRQYRNSWGWAMRVWNPLAKHYLGLPQFPIVGDQKAQEVWDLWKTDRLDRREKIVLLMTFDRCMVEAKHFGEAADALAFFGIRHPEPMSVSHLSDIAKDLRSLENRAGLAGVCFYPMSVAEDLWYIPEGEDDGRYFDLSRDANLDMHWWVFQSLSEQEHIG